MDNVTLEPTPNPALAELGKLSMTEMVINDPEAIKEYRKLNEPIRKRAKYTLYFNTLFIFMSYHYVRHIPRITKKYFVKKFNMANVFLISNLHTLFLMSIFFLGNSLVIGVNPFTWIQKRKEFEDKFIDKESDTKMLNDFIKYLEGK